LSSQSLNFVRKNGMDLRVKKTKRAIIDAFLTLLKNKDFSDIAISDIALKAQVARPTFYLHYKHKQDVLIEYLDDMFAQYLEEIRPVLKEDSRNITATALFNQVEKNAEYLRALLDNNTTLIIQDRLHAYIQEVMGMMMEAQLIEGTNSLSDAQCNYITAALAGMAFSVILQWMEGGLRETPEEMGRFLNRITRPGVVDLLRHGL